MLRAELDIRAGYAFGLTHLAFAIASVQLRWMTREEAREFVGMGIAGRRRNWNRLTRRTTRTAGTAQSLTRTTRPGLGSGLHTGLDSGLGPAAGMW